MHSDANIRDAGTAILTVVLTDNVAYGSVEIRLLLVQHFLAEVKRKIVW
jgi:hypothetical protein